MLKKLWKDNVVGGIIVSAVVTGFSYLAGWWPAISGWLWAAVGWLYELITGSTTVPNVLLALLGLLALAGAAILAARIVELRAEPEFLGYTKERIFNAVWHWRWVPRLDGSWAVADLVPYCPRCEYQLTVADVGAFRAVPRVVLGCEECGHSTEEFDGTSTQLLGRVERKVDQMVRRRFGPAGEEPS